MIERIAVLLLVGVGTAILVNGNYWGLPIILIGMFLGIVFFRMERKQYRVKKGYYVVDDVKFNADE